jgi:PhzF family phenazine biosynthesis protein
MPAEIALVDAFTTTPGAGNRAGVVLDASVLEESQMRAIARAVAASETAFVVSSPGTPLRLRYFTPSEEIPFCGHATLATVSRLAELSRLEVPSTLELGTAAGPIRVDLERFEGATRIFMVVPIAPFRASPIAPDTLLELLGGKSSMLDPALRSMACGGQIFIPFAKRRDLFELAPRFDALADAGRTLGVRGFYAFTREAIDSGSVTNGRYFAPALGVREDPVTGSASGPLAYYLVMQGVLRLPKEGSLVVRLEQGDAMGKPGRVEVEVSGSPGRVDRVRIGGVAVSVLAGHMLSA